MSQKTPLTLIFGALAFGAVLLMALPGSKKDMSGMDMAGMGDQGPSMAAMAGHMKITSMQAQQPGDEEKVKAVIATAKAIVERYKDYKTAAADGYVMANPTVKQFQYHFMNKANGDAALTGFDPNKPSALLYIGTAHKDFTLEGVMYTADPQATEDELNKRIPISIARWHEHIDFCAAPADRTDEYFGKSPKFGMFGSIKTKEGCDKARGQFLPTVFTWMIHVFPYEKEYKDIFSMNDDIAHVHVVK